jgi:hypothetical protein
LEFHSLLAALEFRNRNPHLKQSSIRMLWQKFHTRIPKLFTEGYKGQNLEPVSSTSEAVKH